jgi:TonB-dependent receptor
MRVILRHGRFLAAQLLALGGTSAALAQEAGSIVGRVADLDGAPYVGAEVTVTDLGIKTVTDEQGRFRLLDVAAGSHPIQVDYLSAATATETAEVNAGATLELNFVLQPFAEEISVVATPLMQGEAAALNQQKNAVNITNIVSADQIGRFPDPNAAEATQRVPAITLQRDQGEGRYIIVRGAEPRLNSTTVDGERIPSPEADGRDIALDVIPADLLQSIEVSKALTPDMDGDAIGGSVNLVTKRAPESTRLSATLAGGYNELTEDPILNGNFAWGSRFGEDKKLGLLVAGSLYDTDRGSDNYEPEYDDGDLAVLELRDYLMTRQRYGATASLDHRTSDTTNLYARYLWNEYKDDEIRRAFGSVVEDDALERVMRDRLQQSKITSLTLGADHQIGTSNILDYRVAWNQAREETPDQITSAFQQEDVEFDPNVSPDSIDPNNIQANPLNEDITEYELDGIEREHNWAEEEDIVGAVNFSHAFYRDSGFSGQFKFGAKVRFKEKNQDSNLVELDPEEDYALTDFLSDFQSQTPFFGGRYELGPFPDPNAMRNLVRDGDFEEERDLEEDLADFTANEDTLAGYGMVELELGANMTLLAGLRAENTQTDYEAFELEVDEEGDPVALRPVEGGSDYTELLPMAHFKWRLDDRTNLRFAGTRTLARPNFIDLAPYQLILREDEEIERGNPDLDVTTSWNFDALIEHYFEPVGILSGGIFYKKLEDNIFTFRTEEDFEGEEFDVTQKRNGGSAEILGGEVALQRRFESGFGIFFNFTYVDSDASYPDRESQRLQGQASQVGNFALSYETGRFSGRASLNYHDEYVFEIGEEPEEDLFLDEQLQLDFSATFRFTDRWSVSLNLNNLTDEPYRVYEGSPDRPIQEEIYGWWGTIGLKFDM